MAARTNIWRGWWWRNSTVEEEGDKWHERLIQAAEEFEPLPEINWAQVEAELKRMKPGRGMAVDGFQPRIWKTMPPGCFKDIATLLNGSEQKVMFPI